MLKHALLAAAAAIVAVLLLEGALSFAGWRTLRELLHPELGGFRGQWDEERFAAAARLPGFFRVHPDPFVGAVLKANCEFDILGGKGRSDALGLRMRPQSAGALPDDESSVIRVVVLGDSVAFGFGLDDEDALAARLEVHLNRTRGRTARPVVCRTVAMPGWNYRNEFHFLRDHFAELEPDLVVYLPIGNDVAGTRGVLETGQRAPVHDLTEEDPWLVVSFDSMQEVHDLFAARARVGEVDLTEEDLGADVIAADISPESSRRFDAMARAVLDLEGFLARQGRRWMVVQYDGSAPLASLFERLHRLGLEAPVVPFLERIGEGDTLGDGSHPTAHVVDGLAIVIARALLEHGLLERGEGLPLSVLPGGIEERLAPPSTLERCAALAAQGRAEALRKLQGEIDWTCGRGVLQVFGDITPLGWVGTECLAVIRGGARAVRIELEALQDRPDLYPLEVEVEIGGQRMDALRIGPGERAEKRYVLDHADPRPIEVRLRPERWVVALREKRSILAAFRAIAIVGMDG